MPYAQNDPFLSLSILAVDNNFSNCDLSLILSLSKTEQKGKMIVFFITVERMRQKKGQHHDTHKRCALYTHMDA